MVHTTTTAGTGSPFEGAPQATLDQLVWARFKQLGIQPADRCPDEVFLRRVYLDVIGTLPTADEARKFLADNDPKRRGKLIEALLRRDEFADYWALKWSDLLRVKSEFPINLWPLAAETYHRWIRTCIAENWPYDRFVRTLLTASGSNFRAPEVNFYRAVLGKQPEPIAKAVALNFMGTRAEKWPKARLAGMAAFFAKVGYKPTGEWKEEIVFFDPTKKAPPGTPAAATFPDGKPAKLSPGQDPRVAFADWLVGPQNPWFARNIANRVWYWLLGRGIIQEPDDIRPDNPPSNPELLARLEKELIAAKFDLKQLMRSILNSQTYQLSCLPKSPGKKAEANFAQYGLRRLEAEVLIDAVNQITGTSESYTSAAPEPYTFIPEDQRSIALADGSITSPFLGMFGRPPRDTGLESERNNRPNATQRLHFLNSSHIRRKIETGPKLASLMRADRAPRLVVSDLYLAILSRYPTDEELTVVTQHYSRVSNRRDAAIDVAWALINSVEFLYRH